MTNINESSNIINEILICVLNIIIINSNNDND